MSTTTDLACKTCKKRLWVGQGCYLYDNEQSISILQDFLFTHFQHHLVFTDEHDEEVMEYESDPRAYV